MSELQSWDPADRWWKDLSMVRSKLKSCRSQCFDTTFTIIVVIVVVVIFFLLDFAFNVFYRVTPFQQAQTVHTTKSNIEI